MSEDKKPEASKLALTPQEVAAQNVDPKPFASLFHREEDLKQVMIKLEDVVWRSFGQDQLREPFKTVRPTQYEIRRRFQICIGWIRRARADYGFSLDKTLDLMSHALRSELDGVDFKPSTSGLWTPT